MMNLSVKNQFHEGDKPGSVLILPGVNEGIESDFLQNVATEAINQGQSVLAVNFPHHDRGNNQSPSPDLTEETEVIEASLNRLRKQSLEPVHIVAKSLGSTVLSKALQRHPHLKKLIRKVTILGMPIGDVDTPALKDIPVDVIQGSIDRYGNAQKVDKDFGEAGLVPSRVIEIGGGDHSYRDENRNPTHQQQAIDSIQF